MIYSRGKSEGIGFKGDYFELIGNDLISLAPPDSSDISYEGFNLQIIGNKIPESFATGDTNTTTVFLR